MKFIIDHNKTALVYEKENISYTRLISRSRELGEKYQIAKGSKAILFLENRPDFFYAFLALWHRGAVPVCVDASMSTKELPYYIKDSEVERIFTSKAKEETVRASLKALGKEAVEVIVLDALSYQDQPLSESEAFLLAPSKEDLALMLYTSGTTGNSKGVMLSFDNILYNIEALDAADMFLESDVMLEILPLHHIFPLLGSGILPLSKGSTLIFLKEISSQAILEAFQEYGVTVMIGVPKLWEVMHKSIMGKIRASKAASLLFALAKKLKSKTLSKILFKPVHEGLGGKLRYFVSGASKLEKSIAEDFETLGITICEGYGMTETAPMISFNSYKEAKPGSAGKLMPNLDLRIAEDGEIQVKGRNVMMGYYKKPELTKEVIDEEGYMHTGDLGELKDGYLYITGRKKEMIVLGNGKNINPIDIEFFLQKNTDFIQEVVILEHDGLLTAAIYPNFPALLAAKVVNIEEALKWGAVDKYNKQAPDYRKILKTVVLTKEFPKTKIGKIRRFMVPALLEGQVDEEIVEEKPDTEEYQIVEDYLRDIKGRAISPKAHLELDLGMDSLDMIEFISFLNHRFGVTIENATILENPSVEQIASYVAEHRGEEVLEETNWNEILKKDIPVKLPHYGILARIGKLLNHLLFATYFRIDVKGRELLEEKPTIYVGNHQSFLDVALIAKAFPTRIMKNVYFMAKGKHFKSAIMKMFAAQANVVLLEIDENVREVLQTMAKVLREGKSVLIFPEGVRTRTGDLNSFKKSFAILAKALNVEVQPFVIRGAYELFPTSKKIPKSGKVELEILPKVPVEELSVEELVQEVRSLIQKQLPR